MIGILTMQGKKSIGKHVLKLLWLNGKNGEGACF
jgi:hypothetical protein